MIGKIIIAACMFPTLVIMYAAAWFMEKEQKGTRFGVTLWSGAAEDRRIEETKKKYRRSLNLWTAVLLLGFLLTMLPKHVSIFLSLQMIWLFAAMVIPFVPYVGMNRRMIEWKREYQADLQTEGGAAGQSSLDGDEHWIWGIFYYNKEDDRFQVEKRAGTGNTVNMAKRSGKILTYGTIGAIVLLVAGMCIWLIAEDFTPIFLKYENHELAAGQWKEKYTIPEAEIISAELLAEEPVMSKSNGSALDTLKKGRFFSRELDRRLNVCLNPQEPPYLMIETKEGTWYLLGSSDGEKTRKIYKELSGELQ